MELLGHACLIGHSGFIGGNLLAAYPYAETFNSSTIDQLRGHRYDTVVCAAPQARKWWANQHPDEDRAMVQALVDRLVTVECSRFVLISSVDVFPVMHGVDEDFDCASRPNHAYGQNRLYLENGLRAHWGEHAHIIRLPGMFGPGLKKNALYDLLHHNEVEKIHPGGVFQWYDVRRLHDDMLKMVALRLPLLMLATAPIGVAEIQAHLFPDVALTPHANPAAHYDVRSRHAHHWGHDDGYLYSKSQVLGDMGDYVRHARGTP